MNRDTSNGTSDKNRKRFLIVSTYGSDCAERCYAPYVIGMTAAAVGHDVAIFHMMDAAELGMTGVVEKVRAPPPMQPLREIVDQANELGIKVFVCEQSGKFRKIGKEKLRKGVEFMDVLDFVNLTADADRTVWI